MYCWKLKTLLEGYAAGCLDPDTRRRVDVHLAGCQGCSEKLVRVRRLDKLLDSPLLPELPPGFAARVVDLAMSGVTTAVDARTAQNEPQLWLRGFNLGFVARAAAVAAVIWLAAINGIKVGHVVVTAFTPPPVTPPSQMWSGLAPPPFDHGLSALMPGASGDPKNPAERGGAR